MSVQMQGEELLKWQRKLKKVSREAKDRGITLNDLSEKAGLNRGIITHWITHQQKPRKKNWAAVQAALMAIPVKQAMLPLPVVNAAFDDEDSSRPHIETEAEREAREAKQPKKRGPRGHYKPRQPKRPGQYKDSAKNVLISLIIDHLKQKDVVGVALVLAHVMEES